MQWTHDTSNDSVNMAILLISLNICLGCIYIERAPVVACGAALLVEVEGDDLEARLDLCKALRLLAERAAQDALAAVLVGQVHRQHALLRSSTKGVSTISFVCDAACVDVCNHTSDLHVLAAVSSKQLRHIGAVTGPAGLLKPSFSPSHLTSVT